MYPHYDFVPSIEVFSDDPVITKPPLLTIKNREYRDIPWMNGLVQDEGLARSKCESRILITGFHNIILQGINVTEYLEISKTCLGRSLVNNTLRNSRNSLVITRKPIISFVI